MASIMQAIGDVFSPNDPELVRKTLQRLEQQDQWNDAFSTALLELLDSKDEIKTEIRESLRNVKSRLEKAEAVTQAESELTAKAAGFVAAAEKLKKTVATEEKAIESLNSYGEQLGAAIVLARQATAQAENVEQQAKQAKLRFDRAEQVLLSASEKMETATRFAEKAQAEHEEATNKAISASAEAQQACATLEEAETKTAHARRLFKRAALVSLASAVISLLAIVWVIYLFSRTNMVLTIAAVLSGAVLISAGLFVREVRREA